MRQVIEFLDEKEYEHPFDRQAIKTLKGLPGLETLTSAVIKHFASKTYRINLTGSNIKITPTNFPEIYDIVDEACSILRVEKLPEVYLSPNWWINAYTVGTETEHLLCIESGSIERLTRDELLFVIGHEIGHIKSGHVLYHTMGSCMPILGDIVGAVSLGIGTLVTKGLELALYRWMRMSELTADRAGILACQDVEVAMRVNMKAAGIPRTYYTNINTAEFIKQAREFETYDYDTLGSIIKTFSNMTQDHPWAVLRASEILKWVDSGNYKRVLDRASKNNIVAEANGKIAFCINCGTKVFSNEDFCPNCGTRKQL